jgi:aminopeptidase
MSVNVDLAFAIERMFTNNFNFDPHSEETILFIVDYAPPELKDKISEGHFELINERAKFVELLCNRAKDIYGQEKVRLIKYMSTLQAGKEIPTEVVQAMKENDMFVAITSYSLSHTEGRRAACRSGARGASMPGFLPDMFNANRPMSVDHLKIKALGDLFIAKISEIKNEVPDEKCIVKIVDQRENILSFEIFGEDREFIKDYGLFYEKGTWGNLPAGEIYIAPNEKTANGKITIPKDWTSKTDPSSEFIEFTFKDGKLTDLIGAKDKWIEKLGIKSDTESNKYESRKNFAEFGIGLNSFASKNSSVLESEKMLGTCHFALGTNASFGGNIQSDMHIDFIVPGATVLINEKPIITNGVSVFDLNKK